MKYTVTTPPRTEPLSLEDVKAHLRITPGDDSEDTTVLMPLISAAREYCEGYTGRALASQTITAYPETTTGRIYLPRPPVTAITSVTAGGEPAEYVDNHNLGYITLTRSYPDDVVVVYTTGQATIPKTVRQAMLLLIGHWYLNREAVVIGEASYEVKTAVKALLNQHKAWWF